MSDSEKEADKERLEKTKEENVIDGEVNHKEKENS